MAKGRSPSGREPRKPKRDKPKTQHVAQGFLASIAPPPSSPGSRGGHR